MARVTLGLDPPRLETGNTEPEAGKALAGVAFEGAGMAFGDSRSPSFRVEGGCKVAL